ncbi:hypothetical protein [Brevundimonas sp. SL130]|uniref:hypothetical protein n=1 Tax=Brevundimonas sp. SL130 TaxID=2995143 RepID=UPI00226CAB4E|nr:hypothetical protein [Brevundimonas sp. SL130]WAC59869.1 hypothetical protein OU998_00030 [Brevundimonas sp. SL130]
MNTALSRIYMLDCLRFIGVTFALFSHVAGEMHLYAVSGPLRYGPAFGLAR